MKYNLFYLNTVIFLGSLFRFERRNRGSRKIIILFSIPLTLFPLSLEAAIYQNINTKKELSFSNIESPTAIKINLRKINYYHTETLLPTQKNNIDIKSNDYQNFFISKPIYHEIFQNNSDVPVEINISPLLKSEDFIELILDGVSVKKLKETSTVLPTLDRGEHTLIAKLINKQQTLMTTNAVTFYIQKVQ